MIKAETPLIERDPRVREAIAGLSRPDAACGYVPEDQIARMLVEIGDCIQIWHLFKKESPTDAQKRRASLADKIRVVAEAIKADAQARKARIISSHEITYYDDGECRTVFEFLSDFADDIECQRTLVEYSWSKTPTRNDKDDHVTRQVTLCVKRYLVGGRNGKRRGDDTGETRDHPLPIKEITHLVNAYLGLDDDLAKSAESLRRTINRIWNSSD